MDAVQGAPGTHLGEVENPDGVGEHGSIACGDAIRFTFKVERHSTDPTQDVITSAKYLTFGCTSAIASSEALCDLIEQKRLTPLMALKITNQDIVDYLGGLPQQKIHCSVMGAEALQAAVSDWAHKRRVDLKKLGIDINLQEEEIDEGRMVCQCFSLTDKYLKRKIKELNLHTVDDITNALKAGGACTSCRYRPGGLQDILNEVWSNANSDQNGANVVGNISKFNHTNCNRNDLGEKKMSKTMCNGHEENKVAENTGSAGEKNNEGGTCSELSPYQLGKKVEQVMAEEIRPLLKRDGGDIEVVDIKDHIIYCQLQGACSGCMGAQMTLKMMVERILKERISESIRVIAV